MERKEVGYTEKIKNRVRLAENDLRISKLNVLGEFQSIKAIDKNREKQRKKIIMAVGSLERGEAWNSHVGTKRFDGEYGSVEINVHTAYDITPEGTNVLEVVIFDNLWHAQKAAEVYMQYERGKLEHIPLAQNTR